MDWLIAPLQFYLQLALAGAWVVGVFGLAEYLKHQGKTDPEVNRKVVHIGVGNVVLLAWWFQFPTWIGLTASVFFSLVMLLSYRYPILSSTSGTGRKSLGTFFYAVSIGLLVGWFWPLALPQYAAIGILIMTWGDGLAAIVGQRWGRHPYQLWGMNKSWEGSLTMAGVSGAIVVLILLFTQGNSWQIWVSALLVAVAATALESISKFGVDNLSVPLGSAALCFLCNELWL
ncbi:Phytol kinase [Acaryochloris thomasi RCC1774]|uniref:Phytol kinase n=1 Tax=Acaryochloris thomasi RCC1774 TaxID=1764569 RepID=A0A2W1JH19_9CYAN|nr:diacylglycerol/polyprenol kinase family protein [Acaryochloris thomasi]PZD72676.1 Phytol kinase [Acaryochloris thomasi RCC1774]